MDSGAIASVHALMGKMFRGMVTQKLANVLAKGLFFGRKGKFHERFSSPVEQPTVHTSVAHSCIVKHLECGVHPLEGQEQVHVALLALDKRLKRQDSMRQSTANATQGEGTQTSASRESS
jgi:hypothetical protein